MQSMLIITKAAFNSRKFNRLIADNSVIEHFNDLKLRLQPQRLQVLELLHSLMSSHREVLKALGNESLVGITDLVAGEKDPRNLMIVFSILKVIMMEWDISDHAEVENPFGLGKQFLTACRCSSILFFVTFQSHFDRLQTILMGYPRKISKAA